MKIQISRKEALSFGNIIDVFGNYMNDIREGSGLARIEDNKTKLSEIESFINEHLGQDIQDKKAVKISVSMIGTITLRVDDELIVDFFSLYGKLIVNITPSIVMLAKSLNDSQSEVESFMIKWIK